MIKGFDWPIYNNKKETKTKENTFKGGRCLALFYNLVKKNNIVLGCCWKKKPGPKF